MSSTVVIRSVVIVVGNGSVCTSVPVTTDTVVSMSVSGSVSARVKNSSVVVRGGVVVTGPVYTQRLF